MFIKSQCPWGRTSHHVQAENVGHSGLGSSPALGPHPAPKPLTVLPQIVLPQIRFLLSSGNRCPGRGQSAAVCEAEETGHPGLTAAQREGPALVTSAHLPGKTHAVHKSLPPPTEGKGGGRMTPRSGSCRHPWSGCNSTP